MGFGVGGIGCSGCHALVSLFLLQRSFCLHPSSPSFSFPRSPQPSPVLKHSLGVDGLRQRGERKSTSEGCRGKKRRRHNTAQKLTKKNVWPGYIVPHSTQQGWLCGRHPVLPLPGSIRGVARGDGNASSTGSTHRDARHSRCFVC